MLRDRHIDLYRNLACCMAGILFHKMRKQALPVLAKIHLVRFFHAHRPLAIYLVVLLDKTGLRQIVVTIQQIKFRILAARHAIVQSGNGFAALAHELCRKIDLHLREFRIAVGFPLSDPLAPECIAVKSLQGLTSVAQIPPVTGAPVAATHFTSV